MPCLLGSRIVPGVLAAPAVAFARFRPSGLDLRGVSAVCHGPASLIGVAGPGGRPLVAGRTVTTFSDAEEDAAGTRSASPFSLQEELAALGAIVEVAAPFTVNVRRDGNLVTGQNPMSSAAVAHAVTAAVRDPRQ